MVGKAEESEVEVEAGMGADSAALLALMAGERGTARGDLG